MKKTTFFVLATSIISTLTFSSQSYAKTPGENLDNAIDKVNDGYNDAKDKYNDAKDTVKDKYNETTEKLKE